MHDLSHNAGDTARPGPAEEPQTAREHPHALTVPADLLVAMATSVVMEQKRIVAAQQTRIEILERLLKLATDAFRPEGCIVQ
jgi:hypothetical protein